MGTAGTTLDMFNAGMIQHRSYHRGPTTIWFGPFPYILIYGPSSSSSPPSPSPLSRPSLPPDAESVEKLLKSRNINKSREYENMRPWLNYGLLTKFPPCLLPFPLTTLTEDARLE